MNLSCLRQIGLTENEIKIYLDLLKSGASTAYEISQRTGIYRVHIYDKIEQLMNKGLVTQVHKGAKKYFQSTPPDKLQDYLEEKKKAIEEQKAEIDLLLPDLRALTQLPQENTKVEVFKGVEGLKYILKDITRKGKEILITGLDDQKYNDALPIFMKQYFRDLLANKIHERVITHKKPDVFLFDKNVAKTTENRFLNEQQFNPTNTFIYADRVVIVTWGTPITSIMIQNKEIAVTYRSHFEQLWKIAKTKR